MVDFLFHAYRFNLENKKVLLTFGIMGRNKVIEAVKNTLLKVIEKYPDVLFMSHLTFLLAVEEFEKINQCQQCKKL